jgi:deoxyribodipyrimidine photo-lyase
MDKVSISIVYLTQDQRVHDHQGLTYAASKKLPILVVYALPVVETSKTIHGWNKSSTHRLTFLYQSLSSLEQQLSSLNIAMTMILGPLDRGLKDIQTLFDVAFIFGEDHVSSEEKNYFKSFTSFFPNAQVVKYRTTSFIHLDDLPFELSALPKTYTEARIKIEASLKVRSLLPTIGKQDIQLPIESNLNTFKASFTHSTSLPLQGGEVYGLSHLYEYFFVTKAVLTYKETRNGMLGFLDSTKLSLYLANGNLSPRMIYWQLKKVEQTLEKNASTYWIFFELLWRDYFHFLHRKVGNTLFALDGIQRIQKKWMTNIEFIKTWCEGKTGYPLVDANMKELIETGWMSNRGRQNVASFFTHYLHLDWRIGASFFESYLIDYDVCSNYGNWQYISGVGVDPREDRMFNVTLQGRKYDAKGDYLVKWLPALKDVHPALRYTPWLMTTHEQSSIGFILGNTYPHRIVTKDLAIDQQRPFIPPS